MRTFYIFIFLLIFFSKDFHAQNNWAWMSGSNTATNTPPAFGTQGASSSTTTPGSLLAPATWTDASGNLWLFGGYSTAFGYSSDLWKYSISTNQWTWVKGPGLADQYGVYGTLATASSSNNPGGRYVACSWTDNSGNFWLFGGAGYSAASAGYLSDLWRYTPSTNEWTWMNGSSGISQAGVYGTLGVSQSTNMPGGRYGQTAFTDNSGNLWMFGGNGYAASTSTVGYLNDLWKYDISTGNWTWMKGSDVLDQTGNYGTATISSSTSVPGGRESASGWADANGNLWIFSGYGTITSSTGEFTNDLWKYTISTGNWTWMRGSSSANSFGWYGTMGSPASNNDPGARFYTPACGTDNLGNLWLFGGYGYSASSGSFLNDLWKYDASTNQWTWIRGSSSPNQYGTYGTQAVASASYTPGSVYLQASWQDNTGKIWMYGGYGYTSNNIGYKEDMWKFDLCNAPQSPTNTTASQNQNICSGNSATLTVSGGTNTIKWYASQTSTAVLGTGTLFTTPVLNAVGTSSVFSFYAETFSCSASVSRIAVQVTVNPTPTLSVNSATVCAGGVFVMLPTGANTYTYSSGSQVVFPTGNSSYTVTGTSAQGCVASSPAIAQVTLISAPSISVNSGSVCAGIPFVMVPSGAATYTYSSGSATVTPLSTTFYVVSGTSSLGCVSQFPAVANVLVSPSPTVTVNSGSICSGASFTMNANGALSYTYSGGSAVVSPTLSASYTVSGTNSLGCISSAVSTVTVNSTPVMSVASGSICSGNSFTLSPIGASSYTFSGGSAIVSPTITTSYSISGSSAQGCAAAGLVIATVTVNSVPGISVNSGTICAGNTFTMNPSGAATYIFQGGSALVSPTASANYTVVGVSAQGCTSIPVTASVVVTNTVTISVNSGTTCSGSSFTLIPSGASSYTFSSGSAIVSPTTNSTYTVSGTNASGCISAPAVATISVVALPLLTISNGTICSGNSFTFNPSGAISYTFQGGSAVVSPTLTSTYTVVGSNSVACVSNPVTATVTVNSLPLISIANNSICIGQIFTFNPSGASTYTYSGGTNTVSPLVTTVYTVSGTNSNGCIAASPSSMTLSVYNLPTVTVSNGTLCAGQNYTINPSGAVSYTFSSGPVVSPVTNTSYTVSGTSSLGCVSNPVVASVSVFSLPVVSVNSGTICSGNSFTFNPSGGISYTFQGGSSVVNPTLTSSYTVAGSNSLGCVSSPASATVTVNNLPLISLSNGSICIGQTFTINPSGATSYTYSSLTNTVSPSVTTVYSVTGTGSNGCTSSSSATMTLTVYNLPTLSVANGTLCSGQNYTLNPTGSSTYSYSGGSNVVSPATTTVYAITGISSQGCLSATTALASLTVYALPQITVSNGTICSGENFTLNPGGAVSYTFSSGSAIVAPATSTFYTVSGTSTAGCVSASSATSAITVNTSPTLALQSGSICIGQSFTLSGSGAGTYTYSAGQVVTPTVTSTYSVAGTSAQGCVGVNTPTAIVIVNPLVSLTAISASICAGASATLIAGGADTYTWSNAIQTNSLVISPSVNVTYTVDGTSIAGCPSTGAITATVTVGAGPAIVVNSSTVCAGESATLIANGVNTFTWSTGLGTSSIVVSPTATTIYTVTGNLNGCLVTATSTSSVNVESLPLVSVSSGTICAGQIFTMTANGAVTYTYSGGSATVSPQVSTNYSVTGTGTNGCISGPAAAVSTVVVNALPIISASATKTLLCLGEAVSLVASGADTYTWTGGAINNSTFIPNASGSYSVNGTSTLTGCTNTNLAFVTLLVNSLPTISVVSSNSLICAGETINLNAAGAVTYVWSNGGNAPSIIVSPTTTSSYSVSGSDVNGCSSTAVIVQSVSDCTGLNSGLKNFSTQIKLYPNPNNGNAILELEVLPEHASVELYNYLGQLVLSEKILTTKNSLNYTNVDNGLYTLRVISDNKVVFTTKLIKQ